MSTDIISCSNKPTISNQLILLEVNFFNYYVGSGVAICNKFIFLHCETQHKRTSVFHYKGNKVYMTK